MKKVLFCAVAVLLALGCSKNSKTVLKVGNEKISLSDIKSRLKDTNEDYKSYLNSPTGQKQLVDLLLRERIIIAMAKKEGVDKREEIKKSINDFKKDYKRRLNEATENIIATEYIKELYNKKFTPTEQELQSYYDLHQKDFKNPVKFKLSHILVPNEQMAMQVYASLQKGTDFKKMAKEVSIDPSSNAMGGELGTFKKTELFPEFIPAVEKLRIGRYSEPVKTSFGYHIIKKDDEILMPSQSFEEAKKEIRQMIIKEKFDKWMEQKKIELGVKVNYDLLKGGL